jgi:hypothetical protein
MALIEFLRRLKQTHWFEKRVATLAGATTANKDIVVKVNGSLKQALKALGQSPPEDLEK